MRFEKPISTIHQENRTELMNIADIANIPKLPIYHTPNKPLHFIMGVILGGLMAVIGVFGVLSIPVFWARNPYTAWFLIGVMMAVSCFWASGVFLANIISLRYPYTLAIYSDKVEFLKNPFNRMLSEIGFNRAYFAEFVPNPRGGGGRLFLHYVEFSDDGQYYKTQKRVICTFFTYGTNNGHHYEMTLNALIQAYHKNYGLTDKLPQVNFIAQK